MTKKRIEIIVEADEPALFFSSRSSAEAALESYDIEDGVYAIAFDRSGLMYDVRARGNSGLLVPNQDGRRDLDRLQNTIRKFLRASNIPFELDESLEELLTKCERFVI